MGGRIVAPERNADANKRRHRDEIGGTERENRGEKAEKHHLRDEHLLSAIAVGQTAEKRGADEDAEQ